MKMTIKKIN